MKEIDARKLDCPKPVLLVKEAVEKGEEEIRACVDNETAAANVTRFFESRGYTAAREDAGRDIFISGKKTGEAQGESAAETTQGFLIVTDKIGAQSDGLGEALMKAFLGTVVKADKAPAVLALMNEGVKMALPEASTSEALAEIEARGTKLLICGTCAKHFGITEQIKIGVISNMFEITDAVFSTTKPIVIG